jgi:predicted translin family RNA/ssDNA-binding protein
MKSEIKKAKKALEGIHRQYLLYAMEKNDKEYVEAMNGIFALLRRLAKEEESA